MLFMVSQPDVLLVMLPYSGALIPSLGLASVKAALEQAGTTARILDLDYFFIGQLKKQVAPEHLAQVQTFENWIFEEDFVRLLPAVEGLIQACTERVARVPSRWIGFSVNDYNNYTTSEVIRRLRAGGDRRPVILGGTNCYLREHMNRLSRQVDAVLTGEADETLADFEGWFKAGRPGEPPPGVFVPGVNGELLGVHREPPARLESLPMPDYDGQPWPGHWTLPEFPILMSRGCIGRCAFCDVFRRNGKFRRRPPERVFEEMVVLRERYPGLRLHFNDSLVNGDLISLRRLCQLMVSEGLRIRMIGQARARRDMTPEDYQLMHRAGFHTLLYGVETGSPKVRRLMNKTQFATLEEEAAGYQYAHDAGIRVGVNLIVGFPGETRRELEETLRFLLRNKRHIDLIASISCLSILPHTMLWDSPERYGIDPATKATLDWRTLDGQSTRQERTWRRKWLFEELRAADFQVSHLLYDLEQPGRFEAFLRKGVRRARQVAARGKRFMQGALSNSGGRP